MLRFLLCCVAFLSLTAAIPVDNGIEGNPEVECGPTSITINFNTRNTFEGHVFVKGLFANPDCKNDEGGRQVAGINLPFDRCNVRRFRTLNPKGVFVQTTVIISFHPLFVTKVDRAYTIQCFYMEADKTVDTQLEASMLTTLFQTQQVPMPICRYEILDGSATGPQIEYATVGQQIYHKWTCDTETIDTFCMIVHSCYVDDTNNDRVDLIDEQGCAQDRYLLNNPEYPVDLMSGVEAHVFKFADRADLYFQCQITILVKEPGQQCPKPFCPVPAGRGAGNSNPGEGPRPNPPQHPFPLVGDSPYLPGGQSGAIRPLGRPRGRRSLATQVGTLDVGSHLSSLDIGDKTPNRLLNRPSELFNSAVLAESQGVCLSATTFAVFSTLAAVLMISLVAVGAVVVARRLSTSKM